MRTVAPEQVHALRETRHEAANVARILTERGRSKLRIDHSASRWAASVTESFAPTLLPLVGDHAHKERIEGRPAHAHKRRRGYPDVARHAYVMGLDCNNLHRDLKNPEL